MATQKERQARRIARLRIDRDYGPFSSGMFNEGYKSGLDAALEDVCGSDEDLALSALKWAQAERGKDASR